MSKGVKKELFSFLADWIIDSEPDYPSFADCKLSLSYAEPTHAKLPAVKAAGSCNSWSVKNWNSNAPMYNDSWFVVALNEIVGAMLVNVWI